MVWKGWNNVRNYKFLAKYCYQSFQIFFDFYIQWKLANEILSIFQNLETFGKERGKAVIQQSMRKEKLIKVQLCFLTGCFIMPFKILICGAIFAFWYQDDVRNIKRETRNGELLGIANYNIYFKINFNLLVRNLTQIKFLYWQIGHTWQLIKVNHKRRL